MKDQERKAQLLSLWQQRPPLPAVAGPPSVMGAALMLSISASLAQLRAIGRTMLDASRAVRGAKFHDAGRKREWWWKE